MGLGRKSRFYGNQIWEKWSEEDLYGFLRAEYEEGFPGIDYPSRAKVRELVCDNVSVLDVGCSTGVEYEGFKKYGPYVKYTGVDFTPNSVRIAAKLFPEVPFLMGDIRALPFSAKSFDVVLARHIFEHLPEIERALGELLRVARQKVIIVFFLELQNLRGLEKRDENLEGDKIFDWTYDRSYFYEFLRSCRQINEYRYQGRCALLPSQHEMILEAYL